MTDAEQWEHEAELLRNKLNEVCNTLGCGQIGCPDDPVDAIKALISTLENSQQTEDRLNDLVIAVRHLATLRFRERTFEEWDMAWAALLREIEGPEANEELPSQESGTVLTDRCWSCGHIFGLPANYCPQCNADQANPPWTCTCERCLREKPL